MKEKLREIIDKAKADLAAAPDLKAIEDIRVGIFGKKGELTQILRGMGALSPEERPQIGALANETRERIEQFIEERREALSADEKNARFRAEALDVTAPGRRAKIGRKHPMTMVIEEIEDLFIGMGYSVAEGPEIETDRYNFEALNVPANHPAKDEQDTFYINGEFLLRTQTSSVQIRTMENLKPPILIIAPGKVFRSDEVDATHSPVFHQCEGLVVGENITMGALKGALLEVVERVFGKEIAVRFRPNYFPFTEPSAELDMACHICGGSGVLNGADCPVCKSSGWVELLGCGMVHPNVLRGVGIDPLKYSGFAFGMGLERLALRRYEITDMRQLFENDVRFLKQF
ncbi:phenylalanine--tRNA ligase alpha subunit [Clostridia bacterium]|nr:phenylalanine--tRNA ligase alpha subunit [Clostridia bacterium]